MTRRFIALLLMLGILLPGCQRTQTELQDPVTYCYRRSNPTGEAFKNIIANEQREAQGHRDDLQWLLHDYFTGPRIAQLQNPFPRDTRVISWHIENNTLYLVLNDSFAQLSGIGLTVACGCISITFLPLAEVGAVEIRCENALLDGQTGVRMDWTRLHLSDYDTGQKQESMVLYYTDSNGRYLLGQTATVNTGLVSNLFQYLFEKLQQVPSQSDMLSPIPAECTLLGVSVRDGVCSLDLSKEFVENCPTTSLAQRNTLLAITNTLSQLPEVERVEFYCDGQLLQKYGSLVLSGPWETDLSVVGPVMSGLNETDITLYLCNGHLLTPVPMRLKSSMDSTLPEQVLQTLLTYTEKNDFSTCIPQGTQVSYFSMEDGICYIHLSSEIFTNKDAIQNALHSIAATMCALPGVDGVQFSADGQIPDGFGPLFHSILVPVSHWFAP